MLKINAKKHYLRITKRSWNRQVGVYTGAKHYKVVIHATAEVPAAARALALTADFVKQDARDYRWYQLDFKNYNHFLMLLDEK